MTRTMHLASGCPASKEVSVAQHNRISGQATFNRITGLQVITYGQAFSMVPALECCARVHVHPSLAVAGVALLSR